MIGEVKLCNKIHKCVYLVFFARMVCNYTFPLLPLREGKHFKKKYSMAFTYTHRARERENHRLAA